MVFPQILGSFARVFELALGDMLLWFRAQGPQGLGVALSEGVAALDQLDHYCFTGAPKALVSSVLGPVKMKSLKKGAWPYPDPLLLNLRQPMAVSTGCDGLGRKRGDRSSCTWHFSASTTDRSRHSVI